MKRAVRFLIPIFALISTTYAQVKSPDAIDAAISAAGISKTDPIQQKVDKTLHLLNDEHYLFPKGPLPALKAPFDNPYHLDSLRSPEEILSQKVGGFCGSAALAFAAILERSGVSEDDLRILGSVVNTDYGQICKTKGSPRIEKPRTGASGHVFVLVKFPNENWYLINTTDTPSHFTKVKMMGPTAIQQKMGRSPVAVPTEAYRQLLESPRVKDLYSTGMTFFQVWKPHEYPMHTFEDRFNLIASGDIKNPICRYDASEVMSSATVSPIGIPLDEKVK